MIDYIDYANQSTIKTKQQNDDKCYELEEFFGVFEYSEAVMDICGLTLESSLI